MMNMTGHEHCYHAVGIGRNPGTHDIEIDKTCCHCGENVVVNEVWGRKHGDFHPNRMALEEA
jgi:hypothetical protein